jgi:hypothetical protein
MVEAGARDGKRAWEIGATVTLLVVAISVAGLFYWRER